MTPAYPLAPLHTSPKLRVVAVVCLTMTVILAITVLAQSVTTGATQSGAATSPVGYDVKAAYLLNFGRFMRLDGGPSSPRRATFDICVLGHDYMGHLLEDIAANQTIDNRAVRVLRVADAYGARDCDIVFVSPDEGDGIPLDLDAIGKADVLTVSDSPDFLKYGGMIQFVNEDNRVRFAVNLDAVSRTHIVLSSELLRVASSVTGGPQQEAQP